MKNKQIQKMVAMALLIALILIMQFISGLIPSLGGFSISLVLIPVVLGAAMYGPGAGALLGTAFGLIVFSNCVTGADAGGAMVLQANPFLCFVVVIGKGLLAGLAAGFVYKALCHKSPYLAIVCAAIICPVVNTGVFIACMLLFFVDILASWANGGDIAGYLLTGLILANFVPELLINIILSPASQRVIQIVNKK